MTLETPVALFVFNRPATTSRVWQVVRAARPKQLLIVSDAARASKPGEAEKVAETRRIVEQVDWPCRVLRDYAAENLGCRGRISSGLRWIFEQTPEAILLEDDCLPDLSFFSYCQSLLERHREDRRVFSICGARVSSRDSTARNSYYYSKFFSCWGWATWRRSFAQYDVEMADWPAFRDAGRLDDIADLTDESSYFTKIFNRVFAGRVNTWDYQWQYACWRQGALNILPTRNLVTNIGFGAESTHTSTAGEFRADRAASSITELVHPEWLIRDKASDIDTFLSCHVQRKGVRRVLWRIRESLRKRFAA